MRFKFLLILLMALMAQSACADDRSYVSGEWRYISSWDV
jgi:hypothetical protein